MGETTIQGITGELYKAIITIVDQRIGEIKVAREEFDSLRDAVLELAEAQKHTEAHVEELAQAQKRTEARVEELARAQAKTEARLDSLAQRVEELAEAQKRTEARVEELAEAQKRTEARVEELAQAQKRTEARVEELARAQAKTEEILHGVIKEQKNMRKEIGGLSATIGYTLENRAIVKLPGILEREHGIQVEVMDRRFVEYPDGREEEINIYGEGRVNGEPLYIIGESKSQLGKKDVDKFGKRVKRLGALFPGKIVPVIVTHLVRPKVERYALDAIDGLLIYKSYQLEIGDQN